VALVVVAPTTLALDFDGVVCEGVPEYFETSRRTFQALWPDEEAPGDHLLSRFRDLRPVIETGWEMPVLLRAIVRGVPDEAMRASWTSLRDDLLAAGGLQRDALIKELKGTLDEVRREWIARDPSDWLARHSPYCRLEELREVIAGAERTAVVTTKEGEFARTILGAWGISIRDIQGKEAGSHKCENLRQLIAEDAGRGRRPPQLWFVEDRLETLRCVTTHPDLQGVRLFLAAWGYNTPATRASITGHARIKLLQLDEFRRGVAAWI
jgi:phosphoglycolate phosphatase-like HAD superfamily hydrolase